MFSPSIRPPRLSAIQAKARSPELHPGFQHRGQGPTPTCIPCSWTRSRAAGTLRCLAVSWDAGWAHLFIRLLGEEELAPHPHLTPYPISPGGFFFFRILSSSAAGRGSSQSVCGKEKKKVDVEFTPLTHPHPVNPDRSPVGSQPGLLCLAAGAPSGVGTSQSSALGGPAWVQ